MKLRRARCEDAPALTALIYASKQSNGYDDAFMAACADELRVTATDIAAKTYWIAEGASPFGCVSLGPQGTIHDLFVHPDHKRQGIGRALWAVLLEEARVKGFARLKLEADPAAVPFYVALGFSTVSEAPSGSIPGRMLPHMQLAL
jgi:GNAT superfamily N-acetyltransferase